MVAPGGSGIDQLPQVSVRLVGTAGQIGVDAQTGTRENRGGEVPLGLALPGQGGGIIYCLWAVGVAAAYLRLIGKVVGGGLELPLGQVGEALVSINGPQEAVDFGVFGFQKAYLAGGHGLQPQLVAGGQDGGAVPAGAQLAVEVVSGQDTDEAPEQGRVGA
ncbi:hypothetical protein ES703_65491 [subsurface metagenome]